MSQSCLTSDCLTEPNLMQFKFSIASKMKIILFNLVLMLAVGVVLTVPLHQRQSSPGKVFLLGGAMEDTSANVYEALRNATGKLYPKIVVAISAASSLEVGLEAYFEDYPDSWSYERLFTFYGFQPFVLQLAQDNWQVGATNSTTLGQANIRLVEAADVIFFNGGDQSRHSRSFFNTDGSDSDIMRAVRRRYEEGLVVAGTSAGAAIMGGWTYGEGYSYGYFFFDADLKSCDIGETLRDNREGTNSFRYDENGGYMKGFGFVSDALVDTHFDARGRFGRLSAAMRSTNTSFGFGVGEDTAMFIHGDIAKVYGNDGAWFIDSSEAIYAEEEPYFTVESLKISYLTEGDSLNMTSKELTSTKQLITVGFGRAHNSLDIFSGPEGIDSIKSLVTSIDTTSTGQSQERRPRTNVVFHKGQGELAYQTGSKFSIDKLLMDISAIE